MRLINKQRLKANIDKIAEFDLAQNNVYGSSYYVFQDGNCEVKKHYGCMDELEKRLVTENFLGKICR